ncbi:MAG: ATP-binding protein [Rhodomicrobium sp.]
MIATLASAFTYEYANEWNARKLSERAINSLSLLAGTVDATVGRYKYLPDVIALAPEIQRLFASTAIGERPVVVEEANEYLERVNSKAGSAVLFVLDDEGTGLASSNWRDRQRSIVGGSYRERPYRTQAMRFGEGRFYGQGKTTLLPGYYLATAIKQSGRTQGIAVVKIDLRILEEEWKKAGEPVAVADERGVVFLSSDAAWRYRPLRRLGAPSLDEIYATNQYSDLQTEPLLRGERPYGYGTEIRFNLAVNSDGQRRILFAHHSDSLGWTLVYFGDPSEVQRISAVTAAAAGLAVVAVFMGGFVILERLRTLEIERKAKNELETRVEERTIELSNANVRLESEVEERRKVEADLLKTRDHLIKAARRAALGQFLEGLVHEINQPLAALRTYLASTQHLVAKAKTAEAATNLETMRAVLNHLSQMTGRLKMVVRGDTREFQATSLSESAGRVLSLLRPHLQQLDITLSIEVTSNIFVHGDSVRLDQILLNLLNNAADALDGREDGHIRVSLVSQKDRAILTVEDNGSGVQPDQVNRLFEPFFTTKEPGRGQGLGLATVHRIVTDHDGSIAYSRSDLGGAAFKIVFPSIVSEAAPTILEIDT